MLLWLVGRSGGRLLVLVVLVGFALLLSVVQAPQQKPRHYDPPPACRLVPDSAGAWGAASCQRPHALARQRARRRDGAVTNR
jgi:hypothetical protein